MNLRKLFFLFFFVLFCAATGWAQITPLTSIANGNYTIGCPANNAYTYYDGENAYLRRTSDASLATHYSITQGTGDNAGKYTIQINDKYVVAGSSLTHSATAGVNVQIVDATSATDANKWWIFAQDGSNSKYVDIFPVQDKITSSTPAWNFASDYNGRANQVLGFWSASDNNSVWFLEELNTRAISLNFTHDGSNPSYIGNGIQYVPSSAWNNLSGATGNSSGLVTWNGSTTGTLESNWTANWSAGATWQYTTNISENILKGYLDDDDTNQATVTLSNLPFTSGYDLYIYKAADSNDKFSFVTVTFDNHSHSYSTDDSGIAYFGTGKWGQSQQPASALGTNVICVKGLTAQDITIKGGVRSDGRGAIAAIQLVETGNSRVINVTEDTYDATAVEQPIYLVKDGDLTVTVPNETFSNKYVDVQGVTGTVTYNYTELETVIKEKKETLKATLDNIAQYVGTNVGQITTNSYYDNARALIDNADATLDELNAELAHEATYYYAVNMPQEGVGYLLKNKSYSTYLYNENSKLWNRTTPSLVYFEAVEGQSNQFYIKIGEQYVGACDQSAAVMMQGEKASAHPYSFDNYQGYVILHDMTTNNQYSYLHAVTSNDNEVVGWEPAAQATLWTILTIEEAFDAIGFSEADKFDIAGSSIVKYPNEFGSLTPAGINSAIDNYLAVSTNEEKKTFMESNDAEYLTRYRNLLTSMSSNYDISSVKLTMKAEWGTLIVPFSVANPGDLEVYTCSGVETNGITLTLTPVTGTIVHNRPFIIHGTVGNTYTFIGWDRRSKDNHTEGILTGVLGDDKYVPKDSYILAKRGDKIGFYQVTDDNIKVAAKNKCYLTLPESTSASAPAFFFPSDDDLTGIDSNITTTEDGAIYNLQGLKVTETVKGQIYIKNHKLFKAN